LTRNQQFTLGTANLGTQYGVMNGEKYDSRKSRQILLSAIDLGIHSFDTAPDYGSAEELLGEVLGEMTSHEIFTKIPKMNDYTIEKVLKSCQDSMLKLKSEKLSGVLFHDPNAYKVKALVSISNEILSRGITNKIGFSAYTKEELIEGKK